MNTPCFTTARQAVTRFTYPGGMEGLVDLGDWLHTEVVYPPRHRRSPIQVLTRQCTAGNPTHDLLWLQVRRPNHCNSKPLITYSCICMVMWVSVCVCWGVETRPQQLVRNTVTIGTSRTVDDIQLCFTETQSSTTAWLNYATSPATGLLQSFSKWGVIRGTWPRKFLGVKC